MSILSIDFGNSFIRLSSSSQGVIKIIADNGNYLINNCITFKDYRLFGVEAFNNYNLSLTISDLKRIIGLNSDDIKKIPYINTNLDSSNSFKLCFNNQDYYLSIEHLIGSILNYYTKKNNFTKVSLSVPDYFDEKKRQLLLNSCKVFNIDIFSLVNESESISLDYGFYKIFRQEFKNEEKVLFISLNQSNLHLFLSSFDNNNINIIDSVNNIDLGGIKINEILISFMLSEISDYFSTDISINKKSLLKIVKECEKMKKILSANNEYNFYLESLYDDEDYSKNITKLMFEAMLSIYFDEFKDFLSEFINKQLQNGHQINKIELLGGNIRIPKFKNIISEISTLNYDSTLNFDQTICKGMVLYNSILNKSNTLNYFNLIYKNNDKIEIEINNNNKKILIFDSNIVLPKSTKITLNYQNDYKINVLKNGQLIKYLKFSVSNHKEYEKIIIFFNFNKSRLLKITKVKILKKNLSKNINDRDDNKLANDISLNKENKTNDNSKDNNLEKISKSQNINLTENIKEVSDTIIDPENTYCSENIDKPDISEPLENNGPVESNDAVENTDKAENNDQAKPTEKAETNNKSETTKSEESDGPVESNGSEESNDPEKRNKVSENTKSDGDGAVEVENKKETEIIEVFPDIFDSLEISKNELDRIFTLERQLNLIDQQKINLNETINKLESLFFNSEHLHDKIIEEKDIFIKDKVISIVNQTEDHNNNVDELNSLYYKYKDLINKIK